MGTVESMVPAPAGMNIQRNSVKQHERDKELNRSMNLERDYTLLKHLNEMMEKSIKFDDFNGITFTRFVDNKTVTIKNTNLKIFKLFRLNDIHKTFKLWPEMLADFIRINGGVETSALGVPIPVTQRRVKGLHRPFSPVSSKDKRWELIDGFWKEIEENK